MIYYNKTKAADQIEKLPNNESSMNCVLCKFSLVSGPAQIYHLLRVFKILSPRFGVKISPARDREMDPIPHSINNCAHLTQQLLHNGSIKKERKVGSRILRSLSGSLRRTIHLCICTHSLNHRPEQIEPFNSRARST